MGKSEANWFKLPPPPPPRRLCAIVFIYIGLACLLAHSHVSRYLGAAGHPSLLSWRRSPGLVSVLGPTTCNYNNNYKTSS